MKISSHIHETAVSGSQTDHVPHKAPERSFAQLLNDKQGSIAPPQRQQKQAGAVGLGALGVFGRYGAELPGNPASVTDSSDRANQPITAHQADASLVSDIPAQSSAKVDLQSAAVPSLAAGDASMRGFNSRRAVFPQDQISQGAVGDDGPQDISRLPVSASEEEAPGAAAEVQQLPEHADDNSNNPLFVLGKNDALNIVARGPDEDYAALRERLEDTATQFGMKIADFQLNGSSAPTFTQALGGQNGSRTR